MKLIIFFTEQLVKVVSIGKMYLLYKSLSIILWKRRFSVPYVSRKLHVFTVFFLHFL